ncbi:MAG: 4-hydroxybenzoyl-CoA reductase subunit beta [Cognaticolwellia sp.]|jgi:4-hydroxybenzoyl-CoA reductase subunit beta
MLPLPEFDLHRPAELTQALRLRADIPKARILAGGTDLVPSMKQGLFTPKDVIHLAGVQALYGISVDEQSGIRVGAMTSLTELGRNARLAKLAPGLVAACRTVATPTLQNMATLGGNLLLDTRCRFYNQSQFWREALGAGTAGATTASGCLKCDSAGICHIAPKGKGCYAAHSSDTVPTLILLEAQAELASVRGSRRILVEDLYGEDGREESDRGPRLLIESDEILVAVHIPTPTGLTVHRKVRARAAIDYPMLLVAASADGVVLSSLGPRPQRVTGIQGSMLDADIEAIAQAAFSQAFPLATHVWASTWRKKMVRVEVRRALAELATLNGVTR